MKTAQKRKGKIMLKTKSISVVASIALLGSLGFTGCSNSDKNANSSSAAQESTTKSVTSTVTPAAQEDKIATAVIEGRVSIVQDGAQKSLKSVNNQSKITAVNLDDKTKYETLR